MSVASVPASNAAALTADRMIDILASKLPVELDGEFGRSADDITDDGVFLPDPDRYFRQPAPTREEALNVERVAVFSGTRGDTDYGDVRNAKSGGQLVRARIPWAVGFAFAPAVGRPDVSDPVQSDVLTGRESVNRRAQKYRDGIKHTVEKWGTLGSGSDTRDNAVNGVELEADFARTLHFQIGEGTGQLRGAGFVEFTIKQWQLLPRHDQT